MECSGGIVESAPQAPRCTASSTPVSDARRDVLGYGIDRRFEMSSRVAVIISTSWHVRDVRAQGIFAQPNGRRADAKGVSEARTQGLEKMAKLQYAGRRPEASKYRMRAQGVDVCT